MITLPIFLQMVLEYDAMAAGLSLAPLSLSMFAVALLAGKRAGARRPANHRAGRASRSSSSASRSCCPSCPRADVRLVPASLPLRRRRLRPGTARLAAEQLHALPDHRGARQRGRRRQLGRRLVRPVVRAGVRRRRSCSPRCPSGSPPRPTRARSSRPTEQAAGRHGARGRRRADEQHGARRAARGAAAGRAGRDHPDQHRGRGHARCRSRCWCPLLAGSSGWSTDSGCDGCPTRSRTARSTARPSAEHPRQPDP